MTNWKKIAEGRGLEIPDDELDRIMPVMEKLEKDFEKIRELLLRRDAGGE